MTKPEWLQRWHGRKAYEVANHQGLQDWKALLNKADNNPAVGLICLIGGVLLIIFGFPIVAAMFGR